MGMGADHAVHVQTDLSTDQEVFPIHVAKILNKYISDNHFDLVILGKQSIDGDFNHTGQMLAELSGRDMATFISKVCYSVMRRLANEKVDYQSSTNSWIVEREIDGGVQTVELPNSSILTCDLRLNVPRFPKLPAILKAKKKPIEKFNLEDFQSEFGDIRSSFVVEKVEDPPKRQGGVILESVDELIDRLKNVDKVL